MSFSASTCLTYTGTTILIDPISIYSDFDSYSMPFTAVTLSQITLDNCPLILTGIPDGTTTLKLISSNNYCCNIVLECDDLCTTCDLLFDSYSTDLISRIVAGNLTGSCDNNITNYRINWYKDGDFITPIFASGYGTQFTPYNYTHPLVGNTSPMQPSGIYTPIIDKITINGLNYSQTEELGFIQANLACFNSLSVNVLPFTCDNGSELGNYTHRVNFSGASEGVTPLSLTSVFELSDTTNYFAWKFCGFNVYDSLKITFYGSSYSEPLVLEYYTIGYDIPSSNLNSLTYHKSGKTYNSEYNTYYFTKTTSLENITTNIGDYLILEVIPNQTNTQTNWDFYFTCLDTFDCSLCLYDYINTPYKIKVSTLNNISGSCNSTTVTFAISGCPTNGITNSDIGKYVVNEGLSDTIQTAFYIDSISDTTNLGFTSRTFYGLTTNCNAQGSGNQVGVCSPSNSNSISFQKSVSMGQGIINMTFSHLSDLSSYYNAILPYSGMTFPSTDIRYYKYIQLNVPKSTSPGQICGDGTPQITYYFHPSFVMTSGGTTGNYTLDMTMPTISKNISFGPCDQGCDYYLNTYFIEKINNSSTGSTNNENFSSTTGSRYTESTMVMEWRMTESTYSQSGVTTMGFWYFGDYTNVTMPFSGSGVSYTPIPSLSAQTCDITGIGEVLQPGLTYIRVYDYYIGFPDINDLTSYTIKASPIINGVSDNSYSADVITVVNNVVTYSNPLYTF
jgi:hypothetical protein